MSTAEVEEKGKEIDETPLYRLTRTVFLKKENEKKKKIPPPPPPFFFFFLSGFRFRTCAEEPQPVNDITKFGEDRFFFLVLFFCSPFCLGPKLV